MIWLSILKARLVALLRRDSVIDDIEDEMRTHLDFEIHSNIERGMSAEDARVAAVKDFGNLGRIKDLAYEIRGGGMLEELWRDLRYGARMLIKKPGFTLIVVITLALGIGANTAIFSVVNGVLLKPLGFVETDRLFMLWTYNPAYQLGFDEFPPANADLPEWRESANSFEQIAAFQSVIADLSEDGEPERVGAVDVTANLFPTLGVQPILGRHFSIDEEQPGKDRVAIISFDLRRGRFGGDEKIIGKRITVNQVAREIIGVMPEGFNSPQATEMPQAYNLPAKSDLWTLSPKTRITGRVERKDSLLS